eukprot:TRINITY_DN523_c0_g1_i2.p2 TRINITY_DN523_c0_g1~~TRINITY_DN523_c0_g1_i2.p2  ORF type:complete len:382 (+),score=175.77 TRINITY_DN523_c0_g1_i2:218-1363(+)
MENSYGIGITNRYACFYDSDEGGDPIEILKQVQNDKKAKKTEVGGTKPANNQTANKAPAKKDPKKEDVDNKENRNNQRFEGKRVLDARKSQEGPREERNNKVNQDGAPRRDADDENRGGRGRGGRGGGRGGMGRGGGRGGGEGGNRGLDRNAGEGGRGGGGGGYRGGKREFERKSGDNKTGVKAEEKRGGGGKGNWGTMEDELKGETEDGNVTLDENAVPKEEGAEKSSGEEGAAGEGGADDKEKEEEEPQQLTLDEWKSMQQRNEKPKFNVRKAGEGSDIDPKWKKAAAYKKEKADDEDDEDEDDQFVYSQRANRLKHINVDLHFSDQQSNRGGMRGRGRGRGGRGGGGGGRGPRDGDSRRGDRTQQYSLDDKNAFPALG